jgi:hypothetical protein
VRTLAVVVAWLTAALVALSLSHDVSTWLLVSAPARCGEQRHFIWSSHFPRRCSACQRALNAEEIARLVLFNVGAVAVVIGMTRRR